MSEQLLPGHKTIKVPGPDHPITIEHNTNRVVVTVASRVVADTRDGLILREASYYYCVINFVSGCAAGGGGNTGIAARSLQSQRPTCGGLWRSNWGRGAAAGSGAPRGR